VVFDITNYSSFIKAQEWVRELQRKGHPNVVIAIAGNKADMANIREVTAQQASEYADENGALYYETSAKSAANVNELFVAIAKRLPLNTTTPKTRAKQQQNVILEKKKETKPEEQDGCCASG